MKKGNGEPLARVIEGDCRNVLPTLASGTFDLILSDPPYAEVSRPYGRWTEEEWFALMKPVVVECMRVLKPTGSAVFVLQPNSERVGRVRSWAWQFLAWAAAEVGMVQDAYWWNPSAPPTVHSREQVGLLRPSVKILAWLGPPDCYRQPGQVLWRASQASDATDRSNRALRRMPSGHQFRGGRMAQAVDERGGTSPFNLIPIPNTDSVGSAGGQGHPAGTPLDLCRWWVRYLTPPGGHVLDPFAGSGTVGLACLERGVGFSGIEVVSEYVALARRRLAASPAACPLFEGGRKSP